MAEAVQYVCGNCRKAIVAWSDGNPYYVDEAGGKQYAYHPDHENLSRCIGNDSPHLCLACGTEFVVDSRAPITECPECGAGEIVELYHLGGRRCPYCKEASSPLTRTSTASLNGPTPERADGPCREHRRHTLGAEVPGHGLDESLMLVVGSGPADFSTSRRGCWFSCEMRSNRNNRKSPFRHR